MTRTFNYGLLFWGVLLASGPTVALEFSGDIHLFAEGEALQSDEAQDAVVYFRPQQRLEVAPMPEQEIVMRRKRFDPRVLAITPGTAVNFPNFDPILHNAFSTSRPNDFDLDLYGKDESKSVTFQNPGLVRVYCNVHHAMVSYVVVLDSPIFTRPNPDGSFHLRNVPDTPGELFVWHPRTDLWRRLASESLENLDISLEVTKRRIPQHQNKFGRSYRSSSRSRRRY